MNRILLPIIVFCSFFDVFASQNPVKIGTHIIKETRSNREQIALIKASNNRKYFLENVSHQSNESQIHVWNTDQRKIVQTFTGYNHGQFSPRDNFIILTHKTANDSIKRVPLLYSLKEDKSIPLISNDQQGILLCGLQIANNERHMIQSFVKDDNNTIHNILLQYNVTLNTLSKTQFETIEPTTGQWFFSSDSENILYTTNKLFVKHPIDKNKKRMAFLLPEYYSIITVSGPIASLQNATNALFVKVGDNALVETKSMPWPLEDRGTTKFLFIPQKEMYVYQTDKLSFDIYSKNQRLIGSYTLKNSFDYQGMIDAFTTNETGSYLAVLYNNPDSIDQSKIILFNLSHLNRNIVGTEIFPNMTVASLKLSNKIVLIQGTKTKFYNNNKKKLSCLGESQSSEIIGNSILKIYHTPFVVWTDENNSHEVAAETTISEHIFRSEK